MTTNINLSELDETQGFVIEGVNNLERLGTSVSNAGDINGDGIADIVIGALGGYYYDYDGGISITPGRVYVVFGGSNVSTSDAIKLDELNGSNGFIINKLEGNESNSDLSFNSDLITIDLAIDFAIDEGDRLGYSVSNAGDVNGDGIDDLIIGAPDADVNSNSNFSDEGESYVIFGSDSGFDASISLETLDGSDGFFIAGIDEGDRLGFSVSSAGDINGDGIDDLIIGAPYAEPDSSYDNYSAEGESYVIFGSSNLGNSGSIELNQLDGSNGFVITGIDRYDNSGRSVSSAGDINGDGIDDLIIGAPLAGEYVDDYTGESYVIFGGSNVGDSGFLELDALDGSNGFVLLGVDNYDNSGRSVSSAGDINGDGIDDLIIGAPLAKVNDNYGGAEGESYVVFGGSNVGNSGFIELSELDGSNGFAIPGISGGGVFSGSSVSSAGDINGDGIDDLIIGAYGASVSSDFSSEGQSYIVFGSSEGFAATLDLANLDNSSGFIISGINGDDIFGSSVSSAGDVNNDGIDDLIIGAPGADPNGNNSAGESYVIFGFDASESEEIVGTDDDDVLTGTTENDTISGLLGADDILGAAGDDLIDGDGGDDTLKGGRDADTILGGIGRDLIHGGSGNDFLRGNFADDTISGNTGADVLWGEFGNDELIGGKRNDILIGGRGNDDVRGNSGGDRLIGVDTININSDFGIGEIDTLTGGEGDDTYILADENRVFYDDGDNTTSGESDLAIITTLNTNRDTIQLQGSADLYSLDFFTSDGGTTDARLIYDRGTSAIGEAIAILENVDPNLSVADSVFTFV